MVSSAKGHDKLAPGIGLLHTAFKTSPLRGDYAMSLEGSSYLGGRSAQFFKACPVSRPSIGLASGIAASLLYWSGPSRSLSCHKDCDWNPNHWSCNHRIGMEAPNRANCQNDCWHEVAQSIAPVKTLMDQVQDLQRQNQLSTPAGTALEAASSQVVVQPTAVEKHETLCSDTMDPEPTSSPTQHARHSGSTLGESFFPVR